MLTSVGRAAARRVVAAPNLSLNLTNSLSGRVPLVIRPALVTRSFTTSQWHLDPAATGKTSAAKSSKKSTTTKKSGTAKAVKEKKPEKAAPKKKKVVKKAPAPKKKKPAVKKELTEDQKLRAKVKELKRISLRSAEPKLLPDSRWVVFVSKNLKDQAVDGTLGSAIKDIKAQYDKLSEHENMDLKTQAEANSQANHEARKAWLATLPVEDIYLANLARIQLKQLKVTGNWTRLEDDRLPIRYGPPHTLWIKDTGTALNKSNINEVYQEWKDLPQAERQKYIDQYASLKEKSAEQLKEIKEKAMARKKADAAAQKVLEAEKLEHVLEARKARYAEIKAAKTATS